MRCTLETSLQPRIHARSLLFEHSLEDMNELPKNTQLIILLWNSVSHIILWYGCTGTGVLVLVWVYWYWYGCTGTGTNMWYGRTGMCLGYVSMWQ